VIVSTKYDTLMTQSARLARFAVRHPADSNDRDVNIVIIRMRAGSTLVYTILFVTVVNSASAVFP
jgi:hypothetical protein